MNFEDVLFKATPAIAELAYSFRTMILETDPMLEEGIYGGEKVRIALYHIGRSDNPAIGIAASEKHCQIFIHHFEQVDTKGLKLHGKGKHARHLKFFANDDLDEVRMKQLFAAVVTITKEKFAVD